MDYDETDIAAVYDAARGYSPTTQSLWRDIIVESVRGYTINRILDLGCGTGRYTSALAQWLNAEVVGVDLSEKMLAKAKETSAPGVSFKLGAAEAIPLEEGSVDMVFMSMVFHHLKGNEQHSASGSGPHAEDPVFAQYFAAGRARGMLLIPLQMMKHHRHK
ncbi:MAG: class I SAM-dependent methyltransferase, partial [Pseudomonadota bacterium]